MTVSQESETQSCRVKMLFKLNCSFNYSVMNFSVRKKKTTHHEEARHSHHYFSGRIGSKNVQSRMENILTFLYQKSHFGTFKS